MKINHDDIADETKYHSFIIVQTQIKQIAEKWDYYILSANGQLLMATEQTKSKHEYNLSIESINYKINNKNIILALGDWIKPCLTAKEEQVLKKSKNRIMKYEDLEVSRDLRFFYYLGSSGDRFAPIEPLYFCDRDCLIFQSPRLINEILPFKSLDLNLGTFWKSKHTQDERMIFSFRSEYALLSDLHFLNCLVRSRKAIGSYIKNENESEYHFWMDPQLTIILQTLYPYPKL